MKKLFYFLAILVVGMSSCKKETPPVPGPPTVSYASFTTTDNYTARLTFNFSDPDGDIGNQADLQDTSNYDFFMRFYYKDHLGNYVPFYYHAPLSPPNPISDSTIYPYWLPYVTNNITSRTLSGQVIIDLNGYKPAATIDSLNTFRYTFWIYDRVRHKSNVVTTPEFHTSY